MQLDHKIYAWVGEEYFSRENAFLLYDKYGDAFAHESLPRGQEIYNFCRFFLRYYYYTYIFFICSMSRSRDGDFKGNNELPLHDENDHNLA